MASDGSEGGGPFDEAVTRPAGSGGGAAEAAEVVVVAEADLLCIVPVADADVFALIGES